MWLDRIIELQIFFIIWKFIIIAHLSVGRSVGTLWDLIYYDIPIYQWREKKLPIWISFQIVDFASIGHYYYYWSLVFSSLDKNWWPKVIQTKIRKWYRPNADQSSSSSSKKLWVINVHFIPRNPPEALKTPVCCLLFVVCKH